ncbi:urokinase plasminogen activator surface receptor-like [Salminus brasiliensis]|uniref:urokinase plasminogen activator surface receptor-like n=1 Tax=Salminus brasiliensis TaxID=930266 RepID=UPI003B830368
MKLQITVVLLGVFFVEAFSLQCHDCRLQHHEFCTDAYNHERECSDQCVRLTFSLSMGGTQIDRNINGCQEPAVCINGSINTGHLKASLNSECCTTNLCNNEKMPASQKLPTNGKKCCLNQDCSSTVNCEGDEDFCFIGREIPLDEDLISLRGCVTKSICDLNISLLKRFLRLDRSVPVNMSCCQGGLCNAAEGIKLSLLIMLGPLLSSILFL